MGKFGDATGNKFRLSICLKRFYSDERRLCYVSVWSGLRVRWLAARLRRLFSLSGHFCLLSAGHLLPPDESLALLSSDDIVEVIPKHHNIFEETSDNENELDSNTSAQNSPSTETDERSSAEVVDNPHKDKTDDSLKLQNLNNSILGKCEFSFSNSQQVKETENSKAKHIKSDIIGNDQIDAVIKNTFILQEEEIEHEKLDEVKRKALQFLDQCSIPQKRKRMEYMENEDLEDIKTEAFELVGQCIVPEKKKRKRVRRRKPRTATDPEDVMNETKNKPHQDQGQQTLNNHCSELEGHIDPIHKHNLDESTHSEKLIFRNNKGQNRTARLVYSLS